MGVGKGEDEQAEHVVGSECLSLIQMQQAARKSRLTSTFPNRMIEVLLHLVKEQIHSDGIVHSWPAQSRTKISCSLSKRT